MGPHLLRGVELLLAATAFILLIPTYPSVPVETPAYPWLAWGIALLLLSLSLALACRRHADTLLTALLKLGFFTLYAVVIHLRF